MGGVAVLHPQDCLNDRRDNLFSTPVKSRRTPKSSPNFPNSNPNSTRSEGRKRSPPTGVRKSKLKAPMVTDPPAAAVARSLVMGQVKILKRGESLDDSPTVSKDTNRRKVTKDSISDCVFNDLKIEDFALSSTDRLGPDPELVPKQMNKNMAELFFAGSVFVDSPPPSSLPLPGFFTKNFVADVKEDPSTDLRRMLGLSLC
ncbi:hypothetical protein R6Q59_031344 [Mikania micrantha]|uniref:Uncharacterized protein n=1 Tax=Mikania micrantha TaxID=192012 RepID=A0A5N6NW85_9ASTR|nr:hypothetical protein E3N88_15664 [Mikania micrantha]